METFKSIRAKPDPGAHNRKCNAILRSNARKLDREIANMNLIVQADKRAAREPSRQAQAHREVKDFATELIRSRRQFARLITSKAQLQSVQMQVIEAFAARQIDGSIQAGVGIMKEVTSLVRLTELSSTMRELSVELMKAGIIEETVEESMPEENVEDQEVNNEEIDKVLGEILKSRADPTEKLSTAATQDPRPATPEEEEVEDTESIMESMRNRLESLRS